MTLLSLITSPPSYAALLDEIRVAQKTAATPISWAHTQRLPYLQAVVREGLRMWPPVGGLGFKSVSPNGDIVNGLFVPGGTVLGQNFFGVGRSKEVWGPDADVFRPERWLDSRGEELSRMVAAVETTFGHGKYSCLGKQIALMEIHKTIFEVCSRFAPSQFFTWIY
jgi:cytochrome P450